MQLLAILVISVMIAMAAAPAGSGLLVGAAIGLLINWCLNLQRRITVLEAGRADNADLAEPRQSDVASEPAAAMELAPEVEAEAEAELIAEPQPVKRFYPDADFEPSESPIEKFFNRCRSWITTGNVPVKVGVVLSVFGLAFLIKEAIDRSWLVMPIELRLIGVAAFGIALLIIGWRLRDRRAGYGLSLQGGGIAVVYLTVYAAYEMYSLIPAIPAFALLVATTILAGSLAVTQNARALAVLGIIGGFMAPILASSGSGNHVVLFSYYAILNCAIVGIASRRAWRELNVLGFLFTFVIGSIWGYTAYRPSEFSTTEPFLVLFFLIYVFIPLFFARSAAPNIRGIVDGTLVFGAPLAAFMLQMTLVGDTEYGLAWSAAALTLFYSSLAAILVFRAPDYMRVLGEAFAGLAVVFLTITVPLSLDAEATSLVWAVEGAAMCWLGWRQDRRLPLISGIALQGLAAVAWFVSDPEFYGLPAVLNGPYLGAVIIAAAAAVSSRIFDLANERKAMPVMNLAAGGLFLWSVIWWLGSGFYEISRVVPWEYDFNALLVFSAGSAACAALLTRVTAWSRPAALGLILIPTLIIGGASISDAGTLFERYSWLSWAAVFAAHLFFLRSCEGTMPRLARVLHPLGFVAFAVVCGAEVYWQADRVLPGIWPESLLIALAGALVLGVARYGQRVAWPVASAPVAYKLHGAGFIAGIAATSALVLNLVSDGSAGTLAYVPLFNPLELASVGFAACLLLYMREIRKLDAVNEILDKALELARPSAAVLGWGLLTMICARSVHHYAGVPFDADALMASEIFQATLSIVWGVLAFAGMIVGARRTDRFVWIAGGALMSVVVIKLFLVDLANTGTVERVISFLGVGVLLLVVGYFAPVPPRAKLNDGAQEQA